MPRSNVGPDLRSDTDARDLPIGADSAASSSSQVCTATPYARSPAAQYAQLQNSSSLLGHRGPRHNG
jgi:hypothetical protein